MQIELTTDRHCLIVRRCSRVGRAGRWRSAGRIAAPRACRPPTATSPRRRLASPHSCRSSGTLVSPAKTWSLSQVIMKASPILAYVQFYRSVLLTIHTQARTPSGKRAARRSARASPASASRSGGPAKTWHSCSLCSSCARGRRGRHWRTWTSPRRPPSTTSTTSTCSPATAYCRPTKRWLLRPLGQRTSPAS